MRIEAHDLDLRANWYRRHTAVVGVLAVSTSLFVGIAAAGGLAILSDTEELPSEALSPNWISQPPVVIEVEPLAAPAVNPAPPAPVTSPPVPATGEGRQWRMDSVDHESDVAVTPVVPSDPEPEPESGRQPPSDPDEDCRPHGDDGLTDVVGRAVDEVLDGLGLWSVAGDDVDEAADAGPPADPSDSWDPPGDPSSDASTDDEPVRPGWP